MNGNSNCHHHHHHACLHLDTLTILPLPYHHLCQHVYKFGTVIMILITGNNLIIIMINIIVVLHPACMIISQSEGGRES